ncbi:protein-methionine-sulfoxide reductase catalytic subunit MsrP [Pseudoduganella buxea]|uniref:Protein-methionine-sulfoxide reductase catalytic subunit MsrP n=1 Tax=Pseudoduganella buxea TaxID=1949069 RepID=A0A6I3SRB1_9BURK|nr:protein-methionine-sulfoxide reductase catalytic subunit MsrP [Pseudoduganella buxea]MTV51624.1 protein-methionine-sulfoxide reductase catalytic subunit MsrP [Pseudoduganella buxea]GGC04707.1 protein-methionine-sulfoxide reductase catalytic subunit MsrP [Pseudoduganella buxea]
MLIKRSPNGIDLPFSSEITPREVFEHRRTFMRQMAAGTVAGGALLEMLSREAFAQGVNPKLAARANAAYALAEKHTAYKDATTYNNFYEFGTDKADPAENAHTLRTRPWTVSIEGEVKKPMTLDLDALLKLAPLEERVYRLRCVEGWSMVIPWVGYSFAEIIKRVEPTGNAKYVEFITLADRKQMPGVGSRVLDWPYTEGLRIDEANHPLTLLTLGMYGETLPNQNGAPVRLVVPWKYGFKSAKSIVKIRFVRDMPRTSWNRSAPSEYGFYSNVNPNVDHPRWSQATERRIGEDGFLTRKRKTLMFNGYDVASLYAGMDLKKNF